MKLRRAGRAVVACALLLAIQTAHPASAAWGAPDDGQEDRVIVVLHESAGDPEAVAREHQKRHRAKVRNVYGQALKGYAASMGPGARRSVARDRRVAYVELDQTMSTLEEVPTGVDRIEADKNRTAAIDGVDRRVDVDIAILDTGISPHPDLNVVAQARCTSMLGLFPSCRQQEAPDGNGHGTHVAGTAAAIDNGTGVVGVAPGARLWAVKVASDLGTAFVSDVVAGIDWVTRRASEIEVVNMSLGCECTSAALDAAITRSTEAGVVYVAAAGNDARDASRFSPANHPRVIAVSAMADFDGKAGGGAAPTCRSDVDDTFADFSNFGSVVDLAAPGVCITSTWNDGGYNTVSGTSVASPHAAGAAALYIAERGIRPSSGRWSTVLSGLRAAWSVPQTDPCGFSGGRSSERMLLLAPCTRV